MNPSAKELCDGYDNNCNGYADNADPNGCEKIAFKPMIYGGVRMTKNAIGVGESTTMTVSVYAADGQPITYAWSEDPSLAELGHTAIDKMRYEQTPVGRKGEVVDAGPHACDGAARAALQVACGASAPEPDRRSRQGGGARGQGRG